MAKDQKKWVEDKHPDWGGKDDPAAEAARAKGIATNKRKADVRRQLRENPAGLYENVLGEYLESNPEFMDTLMKVLAEEAVKGDSRALSSMKDIFGFGAPKKAAVTPTDQGAIKKLSKEEVDKKLEEQHKLRTIKGGKS